MRNIENIWVFIGVVFITYFLLSWIYKKLEVGKFEQALQARNGLRLLNMRHGLGIVLFGIVFYILCPDLRFLIVQIEIPRLYVFLPYLAILFISGYMSHLAAQKVNNSNENIDQYAYEHPWSYMVFRCVFLFCYEFFFRGILFFTFLDYFSLIEAISLTTLLYLVIHLFDSKDKIVGTIPFGIILCLITYETQSIWYAFVLHLILSAVYEISIFYNKTLKTLKS